MSEREHERKVVNEFRDVQDPKKVLVSHTSDTGEEPVYVQEETWLGEDRIESGQVQQEKLEYRLDELVTDYYMFSLAPVYLTCLWDRSVNQIKFDLLYRFFTEMKLATTPKVVYYNSPLPLFNGSAGAWDNLLQGLPNGDNLPYLFSQWMKQLVFVDRNVIPMQYWRVNPKTIKIMSPSVVAKPVEVDIFLPTGVDRQLEVTRNPDGTYAYMQMKPEPWVIEEAMRYFGGVDV